MEKKITALPYNYEALEPYLDRETMRVHHDLHHQAYFDKLQVALEKYPAGQGQTVEDLLKDLGKIPEEIRMAVRNNGGGHYHHSLFWTMMTPDGGKEPTDQVKEAMRVSFGGWEKFREQFTQAATTHFGSGWVWLVLNQDKRMMIIATANQDSPISQGQVPLLGIDVWEHAYYLKYQNRRPEYVENWWSVVNWSQVEKNLKNALQ